MIDKKWLIKSLEKNSIGVHKSIYVLDLDFPSRGVVIDGEVDLDKMAQAIITARKAELRVHFKGRIPDPMTKKQFFIRGMLALFAIALWTYFSVIIWVWMESMP